MKVSKLIPTNLQVSKENDSKITLFFNKETNTLCYKNDNGQIVEVGSDTTTISTLQNSSYSYTEVAVSSAEILAFDNGVTLLDYSTLSTDEYFSDMRFTVEFLPVGTPYTVTSMDYLAISANGGNYMSLIDKNILTKTAKTFVNVQWGAVYEDGSGQSYYEVQTPSLISEINIISYNGSTPTLGDGTLLVKIWYKIKTFGTEL